MLTKALRPTTNQFLTAIGVVNAEIEHRRGGFIYRTRYREIAHRVASMGRSCSARVLETVTDDGLYVVGIKGLRQSQMGGE